MEISTDSGSEDLSCSDLDGSERSVVDLEELMDLVNPTGKSSSRSSKSVRIPIFDTTVPSTSGEPTTYFDPFEKFDAPIQVEPEPSAVQGIEVSGGSPAAVGDVSLEFDADKFLSSSLDCTPQSPINTLENFINEASCSVNGDRIFIELESNNSLPSSPNPGNSPSLNVDETNLNSPDLETEPQQNHATRPRTRNPIPDPKIWAKEETKLNRMRGESYVGFRRKDKKCNKIMLHDTPKEARTMGPVCPSNSKCGKWRNRECHQIDEGKRSALFERFWKHMDWGEKKMFIASLVNANNPKRKKNDREMSPDNTRKPKDVSYAYFLKIDDKKIQVCRTTFLNTFGLKNSMARYWLADYSKIGKSPSETTKAQVNSDPTNNEDVVSPDVIQDAECGVKDNSDPANNEDVVSPDLMQSAILGEEEEIIQSTYGNKIEKKRKLLHEFLMGIPKLPSHYCRESTNRLYLQTDITSMAQLYTFYQKWCNSKQSKALSRFSFDRKCKELRLSLFTPKKDQCDLCTSYKHHNTSQETYDKHIRLKNQARDEKKNDKILGEEGKAHVLCVDMMAVKLLPAIDTSVSYYKMKLAIHNYTVYNLGTHDAICFWFTETECRLVSSVFATCLVEEINRLLDQGEKDVIIYSDGCGYQNRNTALSNALLSVSMRRNVLIFQKFLERGHTQMEGDSVHSVIETALEKKDGIYLPHEMITVTKESRKLPFPYRAKMMYHSDFEDYSIDPRYSSIRPGTKANEPVVTDIRCLRYDPSGIISYKLDFADDFQELPRRPKNIVPQNFPPLFREPLQIPKDKWDDLQTLKTFIPIECQQYYENLPHQEESYKKTIGQQKKKEGKKRKLVQTAGTSGDKKILKNAVKKD